MNRDNYSCGTCQFLDKNNKIESETGYTYSYGCNANKFYKRYGRNEIVGSLRNDDGLYEMGCSDYKKRENFEQLKLF